MNVNEIIIEEGDKNYSAYAPDLPGCVATGASYDETLENMYEAIQFHLEAMIEDGATIPKGFSIGNYSGYPQITQIFADKINEKSALTCEICGWVNSYLDCNLYQNQNQIANSSERVVRIP